MAASTVTSKGQVTIPMTIRRALGLRQGSRVAFEQVEGRVELRVVHRPPSALMSGFGMLDAGGRHLPADFDPATLLAGDAASSQGRAVPAQVDSKTPRAGRAAIGRRR